MKKESMKRRRDELRPEYDLTRLKGGVRGKYHQRATAGTNLVLLEPDVALVVSRLVWKKEVAHSSGGRR